MPLLNRILERTRRLVFFGGAGVSTASGIPDFRSKDGLYAQTFEGLTPEMILSKSFFYLNPAVEGICNFVRSNPERSFPLRCGSCAHAKEHEAYYIQLSHNSRSAIIG